MINTSRFNEPDQNCANAIKIPLSTHTSSTIVLTKAALRELRKIYRRGYKYQKAGVMLSGLMDADAETRQADLFGLVQRYHSNELMDVVDRINDRMGRGTIRLASEGFGKAWSMRRENKNQNYTTDWDELLCVQ